MCMLHWVLVTLPNNSNRKNIPTIYAFECHFRSLEGQLTARGNNLIFFRINFLRGSLEQQYFQGCYCDAILLHYDIRFKIATVELVNWHQEHYEKISMKLLNVYRIRSIQLGQKLSVICQLFKIHFFYMVIAWLDPTQIPYEFFFVWNMFSSQCRTISENEDYFHIFSFTTNGWISMHIH